MAKINEVDKMKIEKVRNELRARGFDPYDVLREKLKEMWRIENQTNTPTTEVAQEEQVTTPLEVERHSPEVDEHSQEVVAQDVGTANVAPNTSNKRRMTPEETALPLMKMKDAYKKNPEENSYEVEQILDMRFTGKKHKSREYLIRWKGYSSDHDSWTNEAGLDLSIEKYDLSEEMKKKLKT